MLSRLRTPQGLSTTRARGAREELDAAFLRFKAALTLDQRRGFENLEKAHRNKPFSAGDVTTIVTDIMHGYCKQTHRQDYGKKLHKFLRVLQQFSSAVDVMVGGSQNLVASCVWGVVKLSLQIAINSRAYFEKLWGLLHEISTYSDVKQDFAALFPESAPLQEALCGYLITVVDLLTKALSKLNKSRLKILLSTFDDDFGDDKVIVEQQAQRIRDLVTIEALTDQIAHNALSRKAIKDREQKKKLKEFLEQCSTFNTDFYYDQILKTGTSTWLQSTNEYKEWSVSQVQNLLLLEGKIGCGKSVILANVVESLLASGTQPFVCYHFCTLDEPDSLKARTIIGTIVRQLLLQIDGRWMTFVDNRAERYLDIDGLTSLLEKALPATDRHYYVILDGLHECDVKDQKLLSAAIKTLMSLRHRLHIMISSRPLVLDWFCSNLNPQFKMVVPRHRPEIEDYVYQQLYRRVESGELVLGDISLASTIQRALLEKGEGMFLWIKFQLDAICAQTSDRRILNALEDLPKDLDETYSRVLRRLNASEDANHATDCNKIFSIVSAAHRQLLLNELREAFSVEPGNIEWDKTALPNSMRNLLKKCGSLLVTDEEELTVHFAHHSVRAFVCSATPDPALQVYHVRTEQADYLLGEVCVTYLSYGVFDQCLVPSANRPTEKGIVVPANLAKSTLVDSTSETTKLIQTLAAIRKPGFKWNEDAKWSMPQRISSNENASATYHFLPYAQEFWLLHTKTFGLEGLAAYRLFLRLVGGFNGAVNLPWASEPCTATAFPFAGWAFANDHITLLRQILRDLVCPESEVWIPILESIAQKELPSSVQTEECKHALQAAIYRRHMRVVRYLVEVMKVDVNFKSWAPSPSHMNCRFPLQIAVWQKHEEIVEFLLAHGADPNLRDGFGKTPLEVAADEEHIPKTTIMSMIVDAGAIVNDAGPDRNSALHIACYNGFEDVVDVLLNMGANVNLICGSCGSPLQAACYGGNPSVIHHLLERGAHVNYRGGRHGSALQAAIVSPTLNEQSVLHNVGLLLKKGADPNVEHGSPLRNAVKLGFIDVTKVLHLHGASINARGTGIYKTALEIAIYGSHAKLVSVLINRGATFGGKTEHLEHMLINLPDTYPYIRKWCIDSRYSHVWYDINQVLKKATVEDYNSFLLRTATRIRVLPTRQIS